SSAWSIVGSPTTRYGPAPARVRPTAQPRTPAPFRIRPSGRAPLRARATFWSLSWVFAVRSAPGWIMLSIICVLAPTHWTLFVCATKSERRPRSREKPRDVPALAARDDERRPVTTRTPARPSRSDRPSLHERPHVRTVSIPGIYDESPHPVRRCAVR